MFGSSASSLDAARRFKETFGGTRWVPAPEPVQPSPPSIASPAAAGDMGPGSLSWSAKRDFVAPRGSLTPGTGLQFLFFVIKPTHGHYL